MHVEIYLFGLPIFLRESYVFTPVRPVVRPFVRDGVSQRPSIRFFWIFGWANTLIRLKKLPSVFSGKIHIGDLRAKKGQKWPKIALFHLYLNVHLLLFAQILPKVAANAYLPTSISRYPGKIHFGPILGLKVPK